MTSKNPPDLSNECVRYESVSVAFLLKFHQQLLRGEKAPETRLFVLRRDTKGLSKGETVELVRKGCCTIHCNTPFSGPRKLNRFDVKLKARKDWTIEDVCQYVITPQCLPTNCFYLDLMDKADIGLTCQGSFVSQARKSKFGDLINSLVAHFADTQSVVPDRAFVWLDIFCANQPKLLSKDQENLSDEVRRKRWDQLTFGLHDAIKHFDHRLIYFNSWVDPYPLQRAWCLWEIFGAIMSKRSIDLILQPGETGCFVDTLKYGFESIMQSLADIDLRKAYCHREEDLKMIHDAVQTSLENGFDELNNLIVGKLRDWLLETTKNAVAKAKNGSLKKTKKRGELALLLNNCGFLLYEHSQYDLALEFYNEALETYQSAFGKDHPDISACLNNIGLVHDSKGHFDDALNFFNEALAIDRKAFGKDHPNVAIDLNNIGGIFDSQEKYDEALKYYNEALAIDLKAFGETHPNIAIRFNNIGLVYDAQGEYDEALSHFNRALVIDWKNYGKGHPQVAKYLNNIGMVYDARGEDDNALRYYNEALVIDRKTFGSDHPLVATYLNNMGVVYERQGRYNKARKAFTQALEIRAKVLGSDHPETQESQECLEDLPE